MCVKNADLILNEEIPCKIIVVMLFDVYDNIGGEGAAISEIRVYDSNNSEVNYKVLKDLIIDIKIF